MANLKDLKVKINSTKKTQQTTRAMKMVSAAKLRRAQDNIVNARPYANSLKNVIQKMAANPNIKHPLLDDPAEVKNILLVVVSSDRGLCGGFNSSINKYTEKWLKENKSKFENVDIIFVGSKAADYFKRRDVQPIDRMTDLVRNIDYSVARSISERVLKSFSSGEYQEIRFIYNEFKSAILQEVVDERLLPVEPQVQPSKRGFSQDFIFEPAADEILEQILEKHFAIQVYRALQESVASEHGARMSAMENATQNAGEMIDKLDLEYNKARQAKITTELIEITSGAEAL